MNDTVEYWASELISLYQCSKEKKGFRIGYDMLDDEEEELAPSNAKEIAREIKSNIEDINKLMNEQAGLSVAIASGNFIAVFPMGETRSPDYYAVLEITEEDIAAMEAQLARQEEQERELVERKKQLDKEIAQLNQEKKHLQIMSKSNPKSTKH